MSYSRNFEVLGCQICREFYKSLLIYNFTAPIGDRIMPTSIHSNDPALDILEEVHPGDQVKLPTTIIDLKSSLKQHGMFQERTVLRLALVSKSIPEVDVNMLRLLDDNFINLY